MSKCDSLLGPRRQDAGGRELGEGHRSPSHAMEENSLEKATLEAACATLRVSDPALGRPVVEALGKPQLWTSVKERRWELVLCCARRGLPPCPLPEYWNNESDNKAQNI